MWRRRGGDHLAARISGRGREHYPGDLAGHGSMGPVRLHVRRGGRGRGDGPAPDPPGEAGCTDHRYPDALYGWAGPQ